MLRAGLINSLDLIGFLIFAHRSHGISIPQERCSKHNACVGKIRIQLCGLTKLSDRFGITSREKVAIAKICIHDHGKWIELECALYLSDGLIELAPGCKHDKPKKVVSSCVVGIEFKRAFKFALGFFQIEVSTLQDQTTRDMRFGQVVINCESFVRSRSRFRKNVRWR